VFFSALVVARPTRTGKTAGSGRCGSAAQSQLSMQLFFSGDQAGVSEKGTRAQLRGEHAGRVDGAREQDLARRHLCEAEAAVVGEVANEHDEVDATGSGNRKGL